VAIGCALHREVKMHLEHWQSFRRTYISFLGEYRAGASLEVRKELVEEGKLAVKEGKLLICVSDDVWQRSYAVDKGCVAKFKKWYQGEKGGRLEGSVKGGYLVIPGSRY